MTSAATEFGAAIARRFVREGHHVIAADRRQDRLDALKAELGGAVLPFVPDVLDADAVATLSGSLLKSWREVDVLMSNTGLAPGLEPAQCADLTDQDRMIGTSCSGLMHMTHALLPAMVERSCGCIINIGSTVGTYPHSGGNAYGVAKAFVRQLLSNLWVDLTGTRIRVLDVEPGLYSNAGSSNVRFKGGDVRVEKVYEDAEALTTDDIAEAVYWIAALLVHSNVNVMESMPVCQSSLAISVT